MVEKLILILGDQLTEDISSLRELDPGKDVIIMAEVLGEASYVAHHPKKIILIFSAMRSFSDKLRSLGWEPKRVFDQEIDLIVQYYKYHHPLPYL